MAELLECVCVLDVCVQQVQSFVLSYVAAHMPHDVNDKESTWVLGVQRRRHAVNAISPSRSVSLQRDVHNFNGNMQKFLWNAVRPNTDCQQLNASTADLFFNCDVPRVTQLLLKNTHTLLPSSCHSPPAHDP